MRYVIQHKKSFYITFLILLFSVSLYFFILSFGAYKYLSEEFFPEDIKVALLGNPEEFLEGKTVLQIVETIHIEIFLILVVLLTVFSVNLRVLMKESIRYLLIGIGFISGIVYSLSPFVVKFISPIFSFVQSISLSLFLLTTLFVNSLNIYAFLRGKVR
ncbi:hypothetical protein SAMN06265182_0659 [Persephonella hydrogeniphila]|uniref:Uncharacterized protein n=1 Tax=Persephonella hydrogeniphila TaxID=198703 RepID=A0A285NBS5_9AQUI|nr:hypothetical protein [Persephonella hydrogeniphila]SNZ06387.1 hypothetical protein SAMN06265182_0659 [Persephonella hydrogeniphila]